MENWHIAIILSIVEGLTEFLPVSSSGHLILTGAALDFTGAKAGTFEVVIQLGAIMAVVVLYRQRFWGLLRPRHTQACDHAFSGFFGIYMLLLTSLPACLLGLLLHDFIKTYLFTPFTVLLALVVGAFCMIFVEKREHILRRPPQEATYTTLDHMTAPLALGIGCFQCLALWPGFSRSAATIMGGMLLGARRQLAAEYSFIAAVPIMIAATGYDLLKSWHLFTAADIPFFALGMICSFAAALAAVKIFVGVLSRMTLIPFAAYRLALAPLVYYFMLH